MICDGGSSGALLEHTPSDEQVGGWGASHVTRHTSHFTRHTSHVTQVVVESDFSLPTFASCLFRLRGDAKAIAGDV